MFDRLVESTTQPGGRRAGRVFAATCLFYGIGLAAAGVGAILGFSPVLAEQYAMVAVLAPPPPQGPPPRPLIPAARVQPAPDRFAPPTQPPRDILPPEEASRIPRVAHTNYVPGVPPGVGGDGAIASLIGRESGGGGTLPPEPPKAAPPAAPRPEENPQGTHHVSEGVLLGKALQRVKPAYPAIGRAVRAAGPVQVQITISEQGRVIEAAVLGGHPLLRAAALDAARQWVFEPTMLSKVPVKVQGVLTFNFTLQ